MKKTRIPRGGLLGTVAIVAALSPLAGCGGKDSGPGPAAVPTLDEAWSAFTAGNFTLAEQRFQEILSANSGSLDARVGLGWVRGFLANLGAAEATLDLVVQADATYEDAWAGLAILRLAVGDAAGASDAGEALLALDAEWTFPYMSGVDSDDVRLATAMAYLRQGQDSFDEAQALLDLLETRVAGVAGTALDPNDEDTWVVGGAAYGEYHDALIAALAAVEAVIGAPALF